MKVDNLNGPLYVEVHFIIRACQQAKIETYMQKKRLNFLGIPRFISHGTYTSPSGCGYRFLVMQKLGEELQTVLDKYRPNIRTVCRITCNIIGKCLSFVPNNSIQAVFIYLDALEYIHEQGYIHADIKAQNILRIFDPQDGGKNEADGSKKKSSKRAHSPAGATTIETDDRYYLIDYGLAELYISQGKHKSCEQDKRRANNGTCEFRSRDAHIGVISRRSDIESLAYNLILWFYGRHPWGAMKNPDHVFKKKTWSMDNIEEFLEEAFGNKPLLSALPEDDSSGLPTTSKPKSAKGKAAVNGPPPKGLDKLFYEVRDLDFDEKPNYEKFKKIIMEIADKNEGRKTTSFGKASTGAAKSDAKKKRTIKAARASSPDEASTDVVDVAAVAPSTNGTRAKVSTKNRSKLLTDKRLKSNRSKVLTPAAAFTIQTEEEDVVIAAAAAEKVEETKTPKNRKKKLNIRLSTPFMSISSSEDNSTLYDSPQDHETIKENVSNNFSLYNDSTMSSDQSGDDEEFEGHLRRSRIYINNQRCQSKLKSSFASSTADGSVDDYAASTSSSLSSYLDDNNPIVIMNERKELRSRQVALHGPQTNGKTPVVAKKLARAVPKKLAAKVFASASNSTPVGKTGGSSNKPRNNGTAAAPAAALTFKNKAISEQQPTSSSMANKGAPEVIETMAMRTIRAKMLERKK